MKDLEKSIGKENLELQISSCSQKENVFHDNIIYWDLYVDCSM